MFEFTYCPKCGCKLGNAEIGDEGIVPFCAECKQPYFKQFFTCVIIAVVNERNEVILLKQNYVSQTSHVLVAGFIKCGDNAEETVAKEVAEETGQIVKSINYMGSYFYEKKEMLMLGYVAFVKTKEFVKSVEVDEVGWYDFETAIGMVRDGSIAQKHLTAVKAYIRNND